MMRLPQVRRALPILLLTACAPDRSAGPSDGAVPARTQLLECRADAIAGSLTCAPPTGPAGAPGTGTFGDQGINIAMESKRVKYDAGTQILSADIAVENLMGGPIGTQDGSTLSGGVSVFVVAGPTAVDGGSVTIENADGEDTFTGSGQPYFNYPILLAPGAKSTERTWEFKFVAPATSFTFAVLISADTPAQGAVQNWVLVPGFGAPEALGIHGFGADGQVLYGDSGEVAYRVNGVWRSIYDPLAAPVVSPRDVFANSPNDIWSYVDVGGIRKVRRWDGGNWRAMDALAGFPGQDAVGIGTTGPGKYWAYGTGLWRLVDTLWVADTLPTGATSFVGMAALGADPLLTDDLGRIWFYHGEVYHGIAGAGSGVLGAIHLFARDTSHFWVLSDQPGEPEVRYYDAGSWTTATLPGGYAKSDGFIPRAGVALTNGTAFILANNGSHGALLRWDGASWSVDHQDPLMPYTGVWARNANDVEVSLASGGIEVRINGIWDPAYQGNYKPDPELLTAAWVSAENEGYAINEPGWIYRFTGGEPFVVDTSPVGVPALSLWSSSVNDAWVAHGGGQLTRYDGVSAEIAAVPLNARAVGGSGLNDVWAVGENGAIAHFDGGSWSSVALSCGACDDWNGVWALGPSFAVAVGMAGQVGVWNGTVWTVTTHGSADLAAVSGSSALNAWAVGENGTGWRWNGAAWLPGNLPTTDDLRGVWSPSASEAQAISVGKVFRWNGTAWAELVVEEMQQGKKDNRAITGAGNDVFIGGIRLFRGWR
jgi:hypothetical protein